MKSILLKPCLAGACLLALLSTRSTFGQPVPAIIRGPYLQSATTSNIIVRWRTDMPTESRVHFGTVASNLHLQAVDPAPATEHAVTLPDLTPDTRYFYSILAAPFLSVGGSSYAFTTPPAGPKPTRIWAIGDVGTASLGSSAPLLVRDAYASHTGPRPTDVWLMLGDNAYYSGTDAEYQAAVFDVFQDLLRTTPLWPTLGNHETYAAENGQISYDDIFNLPQDGRAGGLPSGSERYYSFDYGNIHFVSLDSELTAKSPGSPMLTWLEQDLAATDKDWIITYWHSPPYSKGSHDSDFEANLVGMREQVVPILETYGVDLVLCGHSHSYERSFLLNGHYGTSSTLTPAMLIDAGSGRSEDTGAYNKPPAGPDAQRGTVYVVAGSSGQTGFGLFNHPAVFIARNNLGSVVIDIDGNRLDAKFLRENGEIDDHFTILKGEQPPSIVTAPRDRTTVEGGTASFTVVAAGTRPLNYQWVFNGNELLNETNAVLAFTSMTASQAGEYVVVVTNLYGSVTSAPAVLTITNATSLVVHPMFEQREGGGGSSSLFNNIRLQEVYASSLFPSGPILITEIRWRPSAFYGSVSSTTINDFQLNLSTTTRQPGHLSATFAANVGVDDTIVFDGTLPVSSAFTGPAGGPKGFDIIVPLITPFLYDSSQGNLLVDIRNFSGSSVPAVDAGASGDGRASRVFALGAASATIGAGDNGADVLQIWYASAQVAPIITTQPQSQTVTRGNTVAFTVGATGSAPLSYQWLFNDAPIQGATSSTLTVNNVQFHQSGNYSVVVSNPLGSITSTAAVLVVTNTSSLVVHPTFAQREGGGGSSSLFNNIRLQEVYSSVLFPSGPILITEIRWRPSALYGSAFSNAIGNFQLNLSSTPRQPGQLSGTFAANIGADDTVVFHGVLPVSSAFTGPGGGPKDFDIIVPLATPFLYDSGQGNLLVDIRNFSGSSVSAVDAGVPGDGRVSRVFALGAASATTGASDGGADVLQISYIVSEVPPFITTQPQSQTVIRGNTVVFSVGAGGSAPLSYQWLFNETAIAGATNATLTLGNVQSSQGGNYSVVVTNALGTATSLLALLVVTPPPATVRVVSANGAAGSELSVPVELVANGNENALGFSLAFDASVLKYFGTGLGAGVPLGAALLVNSNDVAAGRLGVVVGLPADQVFPEATQQVALVTFVVAPVLNQMTETVNFADQPTLRQLADVRAQVLPAVFVGGTVSITDSQFEGDVASRPAGDRSVATIDWVQMGRFAARLDTISSSNEFQRADCAPRASKGNGLLTVSDWVQAGRYAVGLDPLTVLGGPTEEDGGGGGGFAAASASDRQLCLVNTSIAHGQTNVVPVTLECQGNENAVSFSVAFDPTKLTFVSAASGAGAAGSLLNLNTSESAQGRLGVALAAQPGRTFETGVREVLQLRFAAVASAPATTVLSFSNAPVPLEVSDVAANPLPTGYTAGVVSVTPPPGPPLRITRSGNSLFITWPSSAAGFELQATEGGFGSAWSLVPGVIEIGEQKLAIVNIGGHERYFRLKKP